MRGQLEEFLDRRWDKIAIELMDKKIVYAINSTGLCAFCEKTGIYWLVLVESNRHARDTRVCNTCAQAWLSHGKLRSQKPTDKGLRPS